MHNCIDCSLRRESLNNPGITVAHQRELRDALLSHQGIEFLSHREYMKLGSEPVPPSLLALEPNLRPFVIH
jgi:hypothetical protein